MIRFGHTEIFAEDPLRSKEFYENILGFELVEVQSEKFVWLKSGNNLFLLRPGKNDLQVRKYKNSNSGFVLYTENLEQSKNDLISRGLEFKGTDGSDSCLTFTDPDGNWFQLVDPAHN